MSALTRWRAGAGQAGRALSRPHADARPPRIPSPFAPRETLRHLRTADAVAPPLGALLG
jgi:hypothetical protein